MCEKKFDNNVQVETCNEPSIIILLSFFGELPWYFNFYCPCWCFSPTSEI